MLRKFTRVSVATVIPTLMAGILSGCAATGGTESNTSKVDSSQYMSEIEGEARVTGDPNSHQKPSLSHPESAQTYDWSIENGG